MNTFLFYLGRSTAEEEKDADDSSGKPKKNYISYSTEITPGTEKGQMNKEDLLSSQTEEAKLTSSDI